MWYFTWMLGLAFACSFGVLNAMWLEMHEQTANENNNSAKIRQ